MGGSAVGLELVRAVEAAAVAAARWAGHGDEQKIDKAAAEAMQGVLNQAPIDGRIVIGSGQPGVARVLCVGESVGSGGPAADVAVEALECKTNAARGGPSALTVAVASEPGRLFPAPNLYMDKVAVGRGLPERIVDLDATPADNIRALAQARGCAPSDVTVCILDRPRHASLIGAVRETGARVRLIGDGDIVGVISVALPDSGTDMYLGVGGAPEGVLAAAALRSVGGWMEGRLVLRDREHMAVASRAGIDDPKRKRNLCELAGGDVLFAAAGVTQGPLLEGVRLEQSGPTVHSVLMRSGAASIRWMRTNHRTREELAPG